MYPELLPTVGDLMALVSETEIPQAELWLPEFRDGIPASDSFYGALLTPERLLGVLRRLEAVISRNLLTPFHVLEKTGDNGPFREKLWAGHRLMSQVRQKAVCLGVDADCAMA